MISETILTRLWGYLRPLLCFVWMRKWIWEENVLKVKLFRWRNGW